MMNKELFMKLVHGVRVYDTHSVMKKDVVGVVGLSSIQKYTIAMRMLA
jgi:hypothetical protein